MSPIRMNRRGFLAFTGVAAAGTVFPGAVGGWGSTTAEAAPRGYGGHSFVTRPDLNPALVEILVPANGTSPGQLFVTPMPMPTLTGRGPSPRQPVQAGPLIVDDSGQPVWFGPSPQGTVAASLQVQQYRGVPVLTWWQGKVVVPPGYGNGEFVVANAAYEPIATIRMGNGRQADLHDMVITPQDTALLMAYEPIDYDLTPVGGPANGKLLDCIVQEVDIASGDVLSQWSAVDHIAIEESLLLPPKDPNVPWDYLHMNSIAVDGDDSVLVSGRCTHAIYRMNRRTGEVQWRLNGKKSDFTLGSGAPFQWQHDARRLADGRISLYDNSESAQGGRSRAVVLAVDEKAMTAELVLESFSPENVLAPNMGNMHVLADGHHVVGWGGVPFFSEFNEANECVFHARFDEGIASYRSFRYAWDGVPADLPAVVGRPGPAENTTVFVSWNGATRAVTWRVLAGPDAANLAPVQDAPRSGFETQVDAPTQEPYVAVEALDADGAVLATSEAVPVG